MNNEPVCSGKWIRISTKPKSKIQLKHYIQEMIIDEEENYRLKCKNPSGHNTIMLTITKELNQQNKLNKVTA